MEWKKIERMINMLKITFLRNKKIPEKKTNNQKSRQTDNNVQ